MPSRAAQLAGLSLSRSVSEGLWQPALHQEASHSVNKPTPKKDGERAKRGGQKSDHTGVAGSDSVPTLIAKTKPLCRWRGPRLPLIPLPSFCSLDATVTKRRATAIVVARFVGTLIWNSNIGQISTSKEHVTPWLTYSTSIIFLVSCPVIWNLFLAIRGAVFPQPIF